jgi:hypothetical protein
VDSEHVEVSRHMDEPVSVALQVGMGTRLHRRRDGTDATVCNAERLPVRRSRAVLVVGVPDCGSCDRILDIEATTSVHIGHR